MKKIILGGDHGGATLKNQIKERLEKEGYTVEDMGVKDENTSVDYPVIAEKVGKAVLAQEGDCGLLFCGTGLGICIAANKVKGIRAVTCSDPFSSRMSMEHNNANILCLGGRVIGIELAWTVVEAYLKAEFQGGRHGERVNLIHQIEEKN
ncbi:MAG: ribose 5-phosphate isomerase B [Eubacteriales bacterium]